MKRLSHLAITVCIYRQQSQDPRCVYERVCVRACVRVYLYVWVDGCFGVTLPKTRTLNPMTHLHFTESDDQES